MHDHSPAPAGIRGARHRKLLAISLTITATVMAVQIVGAWISGSLALLADAAHMFTDAAGLIVALIATAVAARPADERSTYGYQRAEVFGALINGLILVGVSVWVATEAISRLTTPGTYEIAGGIMLVTAIVGLIANAVAMWLLSTAQKDNLNVRGAYLEVLGDLLGSVAVIVAAIVVLLTGWMAADAVASLAIAAMILPRAYGLLREVVVVLAERVPKGTQVAEIREHLLRDESVTAVHDIHVWALTRGAPVFSAHIVVEPEVFASGESPALLERLHSCLATHFDVEHSTIQLETAEHTDRNSHA